MYSESRENILGSVCRDWGGDKVGNVTRGDDITASFDSRRGNTRIFQVGHLETMCSFSGFGVKRQEGQLGAPVGKNSPSALFGKRLLDDVIEGSVATGSESAVVAWIRGDTLIQCE